MCAGGGGGRIVYRSVCVMVTEGVKQIIVSGIWLRGSETDHGVWVMVTGGVKQMIVSGLWLRRE